MASSTQPTRQALHLRAAEVLEQEHYARVEALAQHLYLAGAWDKATPYLVEAGDHARAVCAYRDALRCYDQALEAATDQLELRGRRARPTRWDDQAQARRVATLLSEYSRRDAAYRQALVLAGKETSAPAGSAPAAARRFRR